jgi:hypothetical protein
MEKSKWIVALSAVVYMSACGGGSHRKPEEEEEADQRG